MHLESIDRFRSRMLWASIGLLCLVIALVWRGWWMEWWAIGLLATIVAVMYGMILHAAIRSDRHVVARNFRVCPGCRYELSAAPESGTCPECGRPYTQEQLEETWGRWMKRRGE